MNIFDRVQKLIKAQGLTVKQLERECDLANATIRRWETQTPNIESVRRVAHRLNVSTDYLHVRKKAREKGGRGRVKGCGEGQHLLETKPMSLLLQQLLVRSSSDV